MARIIPKHPRHLNLPEFNNMLRHSGQHKIDGGETARWEMMRMRIYLGDMFICYIKINRHRSPCRPW